MKTMAGVHIKLLLLLGILSCIKETVAYKAKERDGNKRDNYGNFGGKPNKKEQKYYQDIYVAQLVPEELEFGHVKETPYSWEQRFEKILLDQNRHQGKVKWNDPKSGYGEFYYDFDHHDKNENGNEKEDGQEGKKQTLDDILADGRKSLEKGEVEFIDGKSIDGLPNGQQSYHGGNYKAGPNGGNQANAISSDKYTYKY